jgi:ammonium transporter Rh
VVQWSIIVGNFFHEVDHDPTFSYRRAVGVMEILDGLFCAGSVMISYGAVLGKVTPLQLTIMAFIEPIFYWVNIYICSLKLDIIDIGKYFT